jgi:carboxyl-terminal processing protease
MRARLHPRLVALIVALSAGRAQAEEGPYAILERFTDVLVYVEDAYVDPVDRARLLEGATGGMVAELDPHSTYLTPSQFAQFLEDTQGEFAGVGVEVDFSDDRLTVVTTMPNSPAERAGILAGDRIVAVDGIAISGARADAIIRRMRGPAGTKIRLTLRREGLADSVNVTMARAIVTVPSVEGKLLQRNIAYIRLKSFQEGCYVELMENVARLRKNGRLTGLLLDLRGNPGGLVSEAVAIADEFLEKGTIYSARHRGKVVETVGASSGDLLEKLPLVVLVGASTASSAEIVAGALQDRKRAIVVGEPTFGKGSVQNVIELPGGAGLLLTTLRYFTPNGRAIQARGLVPDVLERSGDAQQAVREADIAGHLEAEGAPALARPEPELQAATTTLPDAAASTTLTGSPSSSASPHASTDGSAKGRTSARERAPINSVPSDPTEGEDRVLARGYRILLDGAGR